MSKSFLDPQFPQVMECITTVFHVYYIYIYIIIYTIFKITLLYYLQAIIEFCEIISLIYDGVNVLEKEIEDTIHKNRLVDYL